MSNMKHNLLLLCATALLFAATACTQDELSGGALPEGEYPLIINATGLQVVATPASRATVDGNWQGVQTVALSVGGTVKLVDKPRGHHRQRMVALRRNHACRGGKG